MAMLQFYYTSCSKGISGGAGFQYKAMSPGIGAEDISMLNSLIGFRIPPALVEKPVSAHPAALRYEYINPDKCVLVCSQSNGSDENGRPGNFFAHGVLTSPHDFDVMPPIMFWRSAFWKLRDESSSLEIPPEEAFDQQSPALEFDDLWAFLDQGSRRQTLNRLLNAVVLFGQARRPVVILDEIDNIALWILAVSAALPQTCRPLISFATYHHDPYQASFMITGTTADSRFRFSNDEYISYFVLNAQQGRVSETSDTAYARFVSENFTPELYNSVLLDFFQLCNDLIPAPKLADMPEQLEAVTAYYRAIRRDELPVSGEGVRKGLQLFLDTARNCPPPCGADTHDLAVIAAKLGQEVIAGGEDLALVDAYRLSLELLKQRDPDFLGYAQGPMATLLDLIRGKNEKAAVSLLSTYRGIYQDEVLSQAASDPDFLAKLAGLPTDQMDSQQILWKYLMPFVRVDAANRPRVIEIIRTALRACELQPRQDPNLPPPQAEHLLDLVLRANIHPKLLLEAGAGGLGQETGDAPLWLYYKIVAGQPIPARRPYRTLAGSRALSYAIYEVIRDVQAGGLSGGSDVLLDWLRVTEGDGGFQMKAVAEGLDVLWSLAASPDQKNSLAETILAQPRFQPFIANWLPGLLKEFFNKREFEALTPLQTRLYQQFVGQPGLTEFQRGIIGGSIAMTTGQISQESAAELRALLSKMDRANYEAESAKLIMRFFSEDITLEAHRDMIQTVFFNEENKFFWRIYWRCFGELMLDYRRMSDFVNLLGFWFDSSVAAFSAEMPFLAPSFFLSIEDVIAFHGEKKEFERAASAFHTVAKDRSWYPLVEEFFDLKRKKNMLGIFH